jgi:hypothetical protein
MVLNSDLEISKVICSEIYVSSCKELIMNIGLRMCETVNRELVELGKSSWIHSIKLSWTD